MGSTRTSQFGVVDESSVGVVTTPTLFLPTTSFEWSAEDAQTSSEAGVAGLYGLQEWQSNGGPVTVSGKWEGELTALGAGFWLKHALGANGVSTAGSDPYTHTIAAPTTSDGYSFTAQAGITDDAGTTQPVTLIGGKVKSYGLAYDQGEKLNVSVDLVGQRVDVGSRTLTSCETTNGSTSVTVTSAVDEYEGMSISGTGIPAGAWITAVNSATSVTISAAATADGTGLSLVVGKALATASYTTSGQKLLKQHHAHVSVAGTEVSIYGGSEEWVRPIDETDFRAGSRWSKEQKDNGELFEITGSFECEYNAALYAKYRAGTKFSLVRSFVAGSTSLTLTSKARITPGAEPKIDGRSRNKMTVPWMALGNTNADLLAAVLVNSESTI